MANKSVSEITVKVAHIATMSMDDVKAVVDELYSTDHGKMPVVKSSIKLERGWWNVYAVAFASDGDFQYFMAMQERLQ